MLKTGQAWAGTFCTVDGTGALTAATGDPVGAFYLDGVVQGGTAVTITGANPYKFSCTCPAMTAGQQADIYITATVDAIATGGIVASALADTERVSDLTDEVIGTGTGLTALGDTRLASIATILADTNELQTDWHDGGRLDLLLDAAGSGADPLLNTVPGAYASGSAGYSLGRIGHGAIVATFTGPVVGSGGIDIVQGDAYSSTDGMALTWTFTAPAGLSWDADTITLYMVNNAGATFEKAGTCAQTGTTVTATVELTSDETLALAAGTDWAFQLRGTPGGATRPVTPVAGSGQVRARIGS